MTPQANPGTRAAWYAAAALIGAVLFGAAIGFGLGRDAGGDRTRSRLKQSSPEMTLLGPTRSTLLDTLELTSAQRTRIDSLLEQSRTRADSAVNHLMDEVRELTAETRRQVRAVLDQRQQARFDSLMQTATPTLPRTPLPR